MNNVRKILIAVALIVASSNILAHGDVINSKLINGKERQCANKNTRLIAKIELTAGAFNHLYSDPDACGKHGGIETKIDCGQFDEWNMAYNLGKQMCSTLHEKISPDDIDINNGEVVFSKFEGPYEFKQKEHHKKYIAAYGVSLSCYVCAVE